MGLAANKSSPARPGITVDSHQHFWELDRFDYSWISEEMQILRRNYLPQDLKPQLDRAAVDVTVVVQTQHNLDENRWVLEMAASDPWIAGLVGWVDLLSADVENQINEFAANEKFVGVRHVVHDEPDERWLLRKQVINGLKTLARHGLPYDLLLRPQHLKHIPELIAQVPSLQMVIDHLAKPLIASGELEPWKTDLAAVARHPNVFCKISGMITEADHADWREQDLIPYMETAIELFGPARLMFGSDWPVCRLAGEYDQVIAAARSGLANLSQSELAGVFGGNAIQFYDLKLGNLPAISKLSSLND